jgi:hypothetical protein
MRQLSILLLGDARREEFREAQARIEPWGRIKQANCVEAAESILAEGVFLPDVIVVAQAYPGQYSPEAIHRLRQLTPLARILGLLGSWCEGETRTGSPWPATVRNYWHQWNHRCGRELSRLASGQNTAWTLPVTATEEERLLFDAKTEGSPSQQGLIVIDTPSREMHDWLAAAGRSRGFSTAWQRDTAPICVTGATVGLFERSCLTECVNMTRIANVGDEKNVKSKKNDASALRRFIAELHPSPVLVLLDFPRIEDHRIAMSAGAAAVLSKPLSIEDLFLQLDAVVKQ